jgi:hypothetical protein
MTFKAILFMLGITAEYGIDVFQMVVAIWFFSVGYLLFKRASRALSENRSRAALGVASGELSCLTAGSYRTTGV